MEILRNFSQISNKFKNIFDIDVSNQPILDFISKDDLTKLMQNANVNKMANREVNDLAELIFQLNEYLPAVCNFIKICLICEYYEAIIIFLKKLFVGHIGVYSYVSKNQEYTHKERLFDRFVEIVKSTDLKVLDVLPFLFAIIEDNDKTELSSWLAPCLEYMQNIYRENEDDVKQYIKLCDRHKLTYLELGLEFNPQKAIKEIFDSEDGLIDEKLTAKLLKHHYTDTMAFFDKNLDSAGDKKLKYVKILASIENPEVIARLEDLYEEEQPEEIKAFIKSKLGIADKQNLGCSSKHFELMARKKVEAVQERTLGIPFDKFELKFSDGILADNVIKTYLLNIFKAEKDLLNLYGLSDVKTLFNQIDLQNFANLLYLALTKFKDIKEAKWAIRFISLVAGEVLEEQIFNFIEELYKLNRCKEGKYFIECLIYSKRSSVVNLLSKLSEEANEKFVQDKDYFINLYSENMSTTNSDVLDMLVNDEVSESSLQIQKERLYANFIANKSYDINQFINMFINKKMFNKLAQNLVFGKYKNDRLVSLFVVEGNQIKYIAGNEQADDKDLKIKIAHLLDLDERFEEAKKYFSEPTFTQFENTAYAIKDTEKTLTKVSSLQGILINSLKFTANMAKFGFIRNVAEESLPVNELVHICSELNMLAEVSFETPVTYYNSNASLGGIRFYKLNQCLKNGNVYIINKANAIALGGVEPRYYDYVLNAVSKSKKL